VTARFEPSSLEGLRRERIAACLLDGMPSDDEISHARARFLRARARPRRLGARALLITVVQGMVLGLASAAAATFVADRVSPPEPPPAQAPATAPPPAPAVRPDGARSTRVKPPVSEPLSADVPPPVAAFEDLPRTNPRGTPQTEPYPAKQGARSAPEVRIAPERKPPVTNDARSDSATVNRAALPPVPAPAGPWERVANALEAGDWHGADQALNELGNSSDGHARDAAALARAQLWITQGRGGEARGTLEHLATHGKTPLIRRRAAALLGGL
jgi:hypothetical protein